MTVDVEIGEADPVGRMKQVGRLREIDQDVGLLRTAAASFPVLFGDSFVDGSDAATRAFELRPQPLESGAIIFLERRNPFQDLRRECNAGIIR